MSRRIIAVYANSELIAEIMHPSRAGVWHRTDEGVPPDAKLVNCGFDFESQRFVFAFEHESFPEVADGERLPQFDGVRMTAFLFESPASDKAIAELNRLTEKQVAMEKILDQQKFDRREWRVLPRHDLSKLAESGGVAPDAVVGG